MSAKCLFGGFCSGWKRIVQQSRKGAKTFINAVRTWSELLGVGRSGNGIYLNSWIFPQTVKTTLHELCKNVNWYTIANSLYDVRFLNQYTWLKKKLHGAWNNCERVKTRGQ